MVYCSTGVLWPSAAFNSSTRSRKGDLVAVGVAMARETFDFSKFLEGDSKIGQNGHRCTS